MHWQQKNTGKHIFIVVNALYLLVYNNTENYYIQLLLFYMIGFIKHYMFVGNSVSIYMVLEHIYFMRIKFGANMRQYRGKSILWSFLIHMFASAYIKQHFIYVRRIKQQGMVLLDIHLTNIEEYILFLILYPIHMFFKSTTIVNIM